MARQQQAYLAAVVGTLAAPEAPRRKGPTLRTLMRRAKLFEALACSPVTFLLSMNGVTQHLVEQLHVLVYPTAAASENGASL